jgi:hypothetical protein
MSDKNIKTRMIAFADRVSGFDDPSMGDEREANVIMRGHTFALVVGSGTLTLAGALCRVIWPSDMRPRTGCRSMALRTVVRASGRSPL